VFKVRCMTHSLCAAFGSRSCRTTLSCDRAIAAALSRRYNDSFFLASDCCAELRNSLAPAAAPQTGFGSSATCFYDAPCS
jgi:hypothetical protein